MSKALEKPASTMRVTSPFFITLNNSSRIPISTVLVEGPLGKLEIVFKEDRLQIIVVAKKYIYVSQLFISRMPKMRAIPQLVSAPLNPIPIIAEHFRRSHPLCENRRWQHI